MRWLMAIVAGICLGLLARWVTGSWDGEAAARDAIEWAGRDVTALACHEQTDDVVTCAAIVDGDLGVMMRCRRHDGCVFLVSQSLVER